MSRMSNTEWQRLAGNYLQGLQRAGLSDLPNQSARKLGDGLVDPDAVGADAGAHDGGGGEAADGAGASSVSQDFKKSRPRRPDSVRENSAGVSAITTSETLSLETPYPASRPLGERSKALQQLATTVASCEQCSELAACRIQTVFGVGDPAAKLVFFGEGPGADEDRLGQPFVGRSGELLDKIIAACTLRRQDTYILNTVKCRPPGNRNPNESELANCRPFWERQLEILQPDFICCLGSVAAKTLLQTSDSIGMLRGKFHKYRGSRVVVTYHPAYLLRTPAAKAKTWQDMKMLMSEMGIDL